MNGYLLAAGVLAIALGATHSWLGERTVLGPLLRLGNLPELFGSVAFLRRVLRMAWHVTTVLLCGLGVLLIELARAPAGEPDRLVLSALGWTFAACMLLVFLLTRGRHFAWLVFALITALIGLGTP